MFLIDFCTTNNLLQSKTLKRVLQEIQKDDIIYFYWGKGASNILPFLSKNNAKRVVRFHNGDLYDYLYDGYLPVQEAILERIDIAVFISKHGQDYLKNKYPHLQLNTVVSYLGTGDNGMSKVSNDNIFRILTCSFVIPVKRLFLLFEALQLVSDYEIEWTHIGDGPDFEMLKKTVQKSRNNVKVNLLGQISNQEVLTYYQTNMIDAFINVSSMEGLAVSLMEAISFNVSVIGTDVGGTSEIVTSETGILLPSNPTVYEIVNAFSKIRQLKLQPKSLWARNFDSALNYKKFINEILL
jgi:glycosyltransferase involved in cell wall biosynthesis